MVTEALIVRSLFNQRLSRTKIMDSERDNQPSFEDLMAADDISPPRRTTPARS